MTARPPRDRAKAQRSGRSAEKLVCWWLRLKGYRILAVNWRCPAGEVDILAKRGGILAAIEVKRRTGNPGRGADAGGGADAAALLAISPRQQARIARAAEVFAARRTDCRDLALRLDAVTVLPGRFWPRLRHYPAAWQGDSP
jgi:putative endonuclease